MLQSSYSTRICYKTKVDDPCFPSTCEAEQTTEKPIKYTDMSLIDGSFVAAITSPGTGSGNQKYKRNRLCNYHTACPAGGMMLYTWYDGDFDLEEEHPEEGCLDHLKIATGSLNKMICGKQGEEMGTSAVPFRAEFRSNGKIQHKGFTLYLMCAKESEFSLRSQCRELPVKKTTVTQKAYRSGNRRVSIILIIHELLQW